MLLFANFTELWWSFDNLFFATKYLLGMIEPKSPYIDFISATRFSYGISFPGSLKQIFQSFPNIGNLRLSFNISNSPSRLWLTLFSNWFYLIHEDGFDLYWDYRTATTAGTVYGKKNCGRGRMFLRHLLTNFFVQNYIKFVWFGAQRKSFLSKFLYPIWWRGDSH